MRIIRSRVMGFCSGVKRGVDLLEEGIRLGAEKKLPVYTIGPLIHNEEFLRFAQQQGVRVIDSPGDAPPGIAVVRAHGIPRALGDAFLSRGFILLDGTCIRVHRSQRLVEQYSSEGSTVVIAGDAGHGEVISLVGYAHPPGKCYVVKVPRDAADIPFHGKVLLLAQTTFSKSQYEAVRDELALHGKAYGITYLEVIDSICPATKSRQQALEELTGVVDAVIVVGGKHSANTVRLFERSRLLGKPSWLISGADEVTREMKQFDVIGLTAGASTPDWVIDYVVRQLEKEE